MQCFPLFTLLLALGSPTVDFLSLDIEVSWEIQKQKLKSKLSKITTLGPRVGGPTNNSLGKGFFFFLQIHVATQLTYLHKWHWHPKCLKYIINSGGHSGHQRRNRVSFLGQKVLSLQIRWNYSSKAACDDCSLGQNSSTCSPPMATPISLLLQGGLSWLSNLFHSMSILKKVDLYFLKSISNWNLLLIETTFLCDCLRQASLQNKRLGAMTQDSAKTKPLIQAAEVLSRRIPRLCTFFRVRVFII